jgi:hypothetical protein
MALIDSRLGTARPWCWEECPHRQGLAQPEGCQEDQPAAAPATQGTRRALPRGALPGDRVLRPLGPRGARWRALGLPAYTDGPPRGHGPGEPEACGPLGGEPCGLCPRPAAAWAVGEAACDPGTPPPPTPPRQQAAAGRGGAPLGRDSPHANARGGAMGAAVQGASSRGPGRPNAARRGARPA